MTESAPERTCPVCGKSNIEPRGVTSTFHPRRIADLAVTGSAKQIIASKFRCRDCGHEFAEVAEYKF